MQFMQNTMANPYDPYRRSFTGGFEESGQLQSPAEVPEWSQSSRQMSTSTGTNFQPESLPTPAHLDNRSFLNAPGTASDQDPYYIPTASMSHQPLNYHPSGADPTHPASMGGIPADGHYISYADHPQDSPVCTHFISCYSTFP
jgi:hypothetical protein